MAWITDSLRSAIAACGRLNPFGRQEPSIAGGVFSHQLAIAAYLSSGMLRKVISIPADDRVREWRDWQADKDTIALIEAEERRLGLQAKVRQLEGLRGIGGGALIIVTAGAHDEPLRPDTLAKGAIVAANVVSRWQITGRDFIKEVASSDYGCPSMFEVSGTTGQTVRIHPSRVICFRGEPLPAGAAVSEEEAFWGDSRLLRVIAEVQRSDETQAWFAALVKKAKLLRVGIPNLTDFTATQDGKRKLDSRIALIAEGENTLNAVVFDAGSGSDTNSGGEKITDYQVNWSGIPAVMDAFDQRVAAVADIPFTRLMGRSPSGMNSTGEHDTDNWNKMVAAGQNLELRPCLEQLDAALLRSAGIAKPDEVTWRFAPLWTPTEKEEADTFKTAVEAFTGLRDTGSIPDTAFNEALQNWMVEREYMPGLDAALAKIPEAERFGLAVEPGPSDPSALVAANENQVQQLQQRGAINADQARALVTDASPRTLYVQRKLINADELIAWAKGQGFETTTPADEMHVTVCYSRQPVDWLKMGGDAWGSDGSGRLEVAPGGARLVEPLGGRGAIVLLFASSALSWRHEEMIRNGASHDYDEYQPHVTITYAKPDGLDLSKVEPFRGKLVLGPEIFEELDEAWQPEEA